MVQIQWCRYSGADTVVQIRWCRYSGADTVVQSGGADTVVQIQWCRYGGAKRWCRYSGAEVQAAVPVSLQTQTWRRCASLKPGTKETFNDQKCAIMNDLKCATVYIYI